MFALGIRYLCGRAVATHPADRERPEWPPHPDRIFMALVAGHYETDADPVERQALLWLEAQPPPAFHVHGHDARAVVTVYVPVNDAKGPRLRPGQTPSPAQVEGGLSLLPEGRLRQARKFPVAVPQDPAMHLIWENDPPSTLWPPLESLCRKVTYVGHSSSLVQMWVEPSPPKANLVPTASPAARHRLRVPTEGRLEQLDACFNAAGWARYRDLSSKISKSKGSQLKALKAELQQEFDGAEPSFRRPTMGFWMGYETVEEKPATVVASASSTCFDPSLLIFRRIAGPSLGLASTLLLTKALRGAIMDACPVQPVPEWISGHSSPEVPSQQDHLAFLPLPHVGRGHADGHLLGLALAVPRAVPLEEQARCWRGLFYDEWGFAKELPTLRLGRLGTWQLELEEGDAEPLALRPEAWTANDKGSRRWATVTPIALDKHPSGPNLWPQIEDTIRRACVRVGLPAPADVVLSPVSMFEGVPHARQFPCLQRKSGGNIRHAHALLTFAESVRGPVLLGAGRYRGYGFCRPLPDWTDET